jgi:hypothetical protein
MREKNTKASCVALLTSVIILVGCAGPGQLVFENPIVVDHLDGNYQAPGVLHI